MRIFQALVVLLAVVTAAHADPAANYRQLFEELQRCMGPLSLHAETDMTMLFSLRKDGTLAGRPRITYMKLPEDGAARDADRKAISESFERCLPLQITDGFGRILAGRQLVYRVRSRRPETGV